MTKANQAVSQLVVRVVRVARELCAQGGWPGAVPIFHHSVFFGGSKV
jgi:hypothetical protein